MGPSTFPYITAAFPCMAWPYSNTFCINSDASGPWLDGYMSMTLRNKEERTKGSKEEGAFTVRSKVAKRVSPKQIHGMRRDMIEIGEAFQLISHAYHLSQQQRRTNFSISE